MMPIFNFLKQKQLEKMKFCFQKLKKNIEKNKFKLFLIFVVEGICVFYLTQYITHVYINLI
jgi:hypothetical protein